MGSLFRSLLLGLALSVLPRGLFIFNGLSLREGDSGSNIPVSYTHLTLPTIYSV